MADPSAGCPRHPVFSRECQDLRCMRNWEPPGAPTPEEQLRRWAAGDSVCPNTRHECCPDFSCCKPHLAWPLDKRAKFVAADQGTRERMLLGSLNDLVAETIDGKKVYVAGQITDGPDRE